MDIFEDFSNKIQAVCTIYYHKNVLVKNINSESYSSLALIRSVRFTILNDILQPFFILTPPLLSIRKNRRFHEVGMNQRFKNGKLTNNNYLFQSNEVVIKNNYIIRCGFTYFFFKFESVELNTIMETEKIYIMKRFTSNDL